MKKPGIYLAAALGLSMLAACSGGDSSTQSLHAMSVDQQVSPRQKTPATIPTINFYDTVAQSLYIAYFGRPADPAGLANVEAALLQAGAPTNVAGISAAYSSNPAVRDLIDSFASSTESVTLYSNASTPAFVTAVYNNLFGRAPAVAGLSFWSDAISNGGLNKAEAALAILAGSQSNTSAQGTLDAQTFNKRILWASYFTSQLIAQNAGNDFNGQAAATEIRFELESVTASTSDAVIEEEVNEIISNLLGTNQGTNTALNGVVWSGTQFVAVGSGGTVLTSPEGTTWTNRGSAIIDAHTSANLSAITAQNGRLIAVGTDGGHEICQGGVVCPDVLIAPADVIVSSADGITWTNSVNSGNNFSFPIGSELNSIVWADGQFVAVGDTFSATSSLSGVYENFYGNVYTSVDGLNWSPQTGVTSSTGSSSAGFNKLNAVTWSGSKYVALGLQGDIYTSQDGVTWTLQVSPVATTLRGVAWSGTRFVAVGLNGVIVESADGVNWSNVSAANANPHGLNLYAITWSGSQFVAVGPGTILSSPDGINWTARSAGTLNALNSVAWSGSQFAAVGFNAILTSPDGVIWTSGALP